MRGSSKMSLKVFFSRISSSYYYANDEALDDDYEDMV